MTSSSSSSSSGSSSSSTTDSSPLRHARLLPSDHNFDPHQHWYPRALNAQLHPMVLSFMNLGNTRIIERYCHLNPNVSKCALTSLLQSSPCRYFRWSGCDLFNVTNIRGKRTMIVIETNSCPSGQKSMPSTTTLADESEVECNPSGYHQIIRSTFRQLLAHPSTPHVRHPHAQDGERDPPNQSSGIGSGSSESGSSGPQPLNMEDDSEHNNVENHTLIEGALAVVFDKNDMEASGYAAAMVDIFHEPVYLAEFYHNDPDPPVHWDDQQIMNVRDAEGKWHPIRACFRYVTQKPWNRIPLHSRTLILNPVIACLAGGRNKMIADKAYEFFNNELASTMTGLSIRVPDTIRDVSKYEIPLWVRSMGGLAVIKIPYSNAGQGVFTITNQAELDSFMNSEHHYDKFIVQSLVGNAEWQKNMQREQRPNTYFHCGTIPNRKLESYVCDLRCMISSTDRGFQPLAVYARRALAPLKGTLTSSDDSWNMLGTNLSVKKEDGSWTTDTARLLLMDCKDFNKLGVAIDELIDAYVQTCLATLAIDRMAIRLMSGPQRSFDHSLYFSLNSDKALIDEISQM